MVKLKSGFYDTTMLLFIFCWCFFLLYLTYCNKYFFYRIITTFSFLSFTIVYEIDFYWSSQKLRSF
jgi:hypothetical protein